MEMLKWVDKPSPELDRMARRTEELDEEDIGAGRGRMEVFRKTV